MPETHTDRKPLGAVDLAQAELVRRGLENIRRRLLDLTNRNKLISFRHSRSSLRIVDVDLNAVYQSLLDDKRFPFVYVPEPSNGHIALLGEKPAAKDYADEIGWSTSFDLVNGTGQTACLPVLYYQEDFERHSGNRLVTWLLNPVIGKPLNPQSLPTLNGIAAVRGTDSALVAVGQNGTILRTDDGGRSWRQLLSGTGTSLHSIAFSTRLSGWAVGDDGTILHTTDGGANWRSQTIGTGARLQRVIFISEEQGWVVGADGLILATRDGGAS
jgi:hypothetical protein